MQIQALLEKYSKNDMRALKDLTYPIFIKFGLPQSEFDDFVSIANLTLWKCAKSYNYDKNDNFDAFLRGCLQNKFKTELTRRNRQRRISDNMKVSLDAESEETDHSLLDTMASDFDTFEEVMKEYESVRFHEKIQAYISRLSSKQISILNLLMDGYTQNEIREILQITTKEFTDNMQTMRAYENIKNLL